MVYVRQSHRSKSPRTWSPRQGNRAWWSAPSPGLSPERVIVIDEIKAKRPEHGHALGLSALASRGQLGPCGADLGLELSRLARSNKDWHNCSNSVPSLDLLADAMGSMIRPTTTIAYCWAAWHDERSGTLHPQSRMHEGRRNKAQPGTCCIIRPWGMCGEPTGLSARSGRAGAAGRAVDF